MKKALLTFVALSGLFLSGCATPPPVNFSVPNVGPSQAKIDAEVKSITVSSARPDESSGDLPMWTTNILPQWKEALEEALNKMAIFKDDSKNKLSISVKVTKIDTPSAGFSMTTDVAARYELISRADGSIIYTTDIDATGVCPGDYAFLGATRATESFNRAIQNNISKFLMQLETVNINKPMFPTKAGEKK